MRRQAIVDIDIRAVTTKSLTFHKDKIRGAMRQLGREVQVQEQALVNRSGTSKPGQFPGRVTGKLRRSIRSRLSRSGFSVAIGPSRKSFGEGEFYPIFLHLGVRAQRNKNHKAHGQSEPYRIKPRRNHARAALEMKRKRVRLVLLDAVRGGTVSK